MSCTSGAKTSKIMRIHWYTRKYDKPFETDEKLKVAKQATTKTSFLTLSSSKISILVIAILPKNEGDYDTND